MYTNFGIGQSGECPCNTGPMTAAHILQSCPTHEELRSREWPSPRSLEDQLYGTLGDLRTTVAFIEKTGVDI